MTTTIARVIETTEVKPQDLKAGMKYVSTFGIVKVDKVEIGKETYKVYFTDRYGKQLWESAALANWPETVK